jgi:hypothetical protein
MHFLDRIDWAGCMLADGTESKSDPIRIHELAIAIWPAFAKRVLTQILAGCWKRIAERPNDFVIELHETSHLEAPMVRLFGHAPGLKLLELIRRREYTEIRRLAPSYRARLILRAFLPGNGVRISAPWLTGKLARTFGIAPWRPPFLVLAYPEGFDGPALLAEVVSKLGFAKCWILPPKRPNSLLARLRERWQIHVHRSLFRLAAHLCPLDPETQPDVKPACIYGFSDGDLFVASVQKASGDKCRLWSGNALVIDLTFPTKNPAFIAAQIANQYLLSLTQPRHLRNATSQKTP